MFLRLIYSDRLSGADANAVPQYVSDHKTQYKWLAGIEFIEVVPKNPSGKLLRRLLRDRLKEGLQEGRIKLVQPGSKERAKL